MTSHLPEVPAEFVAVGPPLARGGSAVVWRARHRVTGRDVALKVWFRPLDTDQQRQEFDAESRRHLRLSDNPHIVGWLWAAAPPREPAWMATELHGRSLAEILADDGTFAVEQGIVIGLDLLDGLGAVHASGLVHRDVKPENVLVQDGRAALCDLGIATRVGGLVDDAMAGTAGYLAPELAGASPSTPDFRSDVYSAARTIRQAVGNDVPGQLDQLLTRAQSHDPADRPVDAGDFADRLRKVNSQLGFADRAADSEANADGPTPTAVHRRRRRARWTPVIAAAAVIAVIAVFFVVRSSSSASPQGGPTPAAAGAAPDIDKADRPIRIGQRGEGTCLSDGSAAGNVDNTYEGVVVATTIVNRDPTTGQACARLHKPKDSPQYGKLTYLAITLCNGQGTCNSDWFDYAYEAGPVTVPYTTGCLSWRVSMMDSTGQKWLIRDVVGQLGC